MATLLLLADGRLPTGGHVHSGGVEEAVNDGRIRDVASLRDYLVGRLATSGRVDAGLAASCWDLATCSDVTHDSGFSPASGYGPGAAYGTGAGSSAGPDGVSSGGEIARRWAFADAEAAARCPVPALRTAARSQGRGLLRAAARMWPSPVSLATVAGVHPDGPMWPLSVGAVAANAGVGRHGAAIVAAQASVSGPAWAAVRLLGLDPFSVAALLAEMTAAVDAVASGAATRHGAVSAETTDVPGGGFVAAETTGFAFAEAATPKSAGFVFAETETETQTESWLQIRAMLAALPAAGGPLTDIAAVTHTQREVRLFAS